MSGTFSMVCMATPLWMLVLPVCWAWAEGSPDPLPEDWHVDRALFPEAYGILSSDHLMFPVDVSDWPLRIDSRRQLFVDDYLIASMDGLKRKWHEPVKHPGNPVMEGELP